MTAPDHKQLSASGTIRRAATRREMLQRMLAGIGIAFAGPALASAHPMHRHLSNPLEMDAAFARADGSEWSPEFLDSHQNETLITLSEAIVSGAAKAQVNRIIDLLLTIETAQNQQAFTASLSALDREAVARFRKNIARLSSKQVDDVLAKSASTTSEHLPQHDDAFADWKTNQNKPIPGPANLRDHFENLKGWIVATYYSSEEGMRELGWTEEFYFENPEECSHPGEHSS